MKRIKALLLCFVLVCSFSTIAYAETLPDTETKGEAVISASVPDSHKITVLSEGAAVFLNGTEAEVFDVERLSEPVVLIRAESGKKIKQVLLNGEDITAQIKGGYYTFSPVFEDKELRIITEDTPAVPQSKTYIVRGTVERNGEPVENITLELRSTLKTDVTDKDGRFQFDGVECGKHSLTALENGKVVGYMEFILTEGEQTEFSLQGNGLYTVTVNENEIGIDLTLNLEEDGSITIKDIKDNTPTKPDKADKPDKPDKTDNLDKTGTGGNVPRTGDNSRPWLWLILMFASCGGLVIAVFYGNIKEVFRF